MTKEPGDLYVIHQYGHMELGLYLPHKKHILSLFNVVIFSDLTWVGEDHSLMSLNNHL